MRRLLPMLAGLILATPAVADDDPWGLGDDSPWSEAPAAPPADPADPWAPPVDPAALPAPPPPPIMPIGQAPPSLGFSSRDRCRAAWRGDRGWVQRLVPTWSHPTVERCVYAAGADRWAIAEQPASMVISAAVDLPLVALSAGLGVWAATTDPVARGRDSWDVVSASERAVAGVGAQRRDLLSSRTEPDQAARITSDVLAGGALLAAAASPLTLPRHNGRLTNLAVMTEVVGLNIAVQQLVARRVAEPRPLGFQDMSAWSDDDFAVVAESLTTDHAWTSYYSAHTSTVASVAYGYATIYTIDAFDADSSSAAMSLMLYPVAFMLSNLQGQLRIDVLEHDPTDVWTGHMAGGLIGTGVPLLHHLVALHGRARPGAPQAAPAGPPRVMTPTVAPLSGGGATVGLQGRW